VKKNGVDSDKGEAPLIRPQTLKRMLAGFSVVLGLLLLIEWLFHPHTIFPWEGWHGFYAAYGFIAYVMLVFVAQYLLRPIVMRDEGYYDR